MPAAESIRAKAFSAAADSSGVPSNKSWSPETARSKPAPLSGPSAVRNSVHAVEYCLAVRGCPNSYIRANLRRIFRLRTKARAAVVRVLSVFASIRSSGRLPPLHVNMGFRGGKNNGTRVVFGTTWKAICALVLQSRWPGRDRQRLLSHFSNSVMSPRMATAPNFRKSGPRCRLSMEPRGSMPINGTPADWLASASSTLSPR